MRPKTSISSGYLNEHGVAMITVLLIMVIMTVIGIAGITVTALENRIAGFQRTGEAAATAAESCVGTAVNVIMQSIPLSALPDAFKASNGGPVPDANAPTVAQEIFGQLDNNADSVTDVVPNLQMAIGGYTVNGDLDRLYAKVRTGSAIEFASGYDGSPGGGGVDIIYRIDCMATNAATSTNSRITAIYACAVQGDSCQRKI